MVIPVLKVFYKKKIKKKIIQCRSYKNFDNQLSQRVVNSELLKIDLNNADYQNLLILFSQYLTSMLQKNKSLKEQITRNKYLRERKNEAKSLYNKQRNLCVSILH